VVFRRVPLLKFMLKTASSSMVEGSSTGQVTSHRHSPSAASPAGLTGVRIQLAPTLAMQNR
jgi:hypothetical protein